jgi:hypothetical protein
MKSPKALVLILSLVLLSACGSARPAAENAAPATQVADRGAAKSQAEPAGAAANQVSLQQAGDSQSTAEAMDRKIIRDAALTLEVSAPADVQRKISTIAETLGGFVVTSESKERQTGDGRHELEVNLVIRVPAAQFSAALDQVRSAGNRVVQEKVTGQDVTEEFIDLEAHIKTQKALEAQFLEIMKRAARVEDALEVQRQIAEVRTQIEKLEGRKRFLENRASLSTITVSLQTPTAIAVNTSGFGRDVRQAAADSVQVAIAIVLFLIRFVIVMIPIFVLLILPLWFVARYFVRRAKRAARSLKGRAANVDSGAPAAPDSTPK